MLGYIIQFSVFLLIFWVVYELFLKKETFFTYNRLYLLFTPIASACLPFISFNFLESYAVEAQHLVQLPAVFIGDPIINETTTQVTKTVTSSAGFLEKHALFIIYIVGAIFSAVIFIRKIFQFQQFRKKGAISYFKNLKLIEISNSKIACTFFKTIYIGNDLAENEKAQILKHEQVHAQQYHSLDLLFFEVLKIVLWFNPIVYFYQKQLTNLHEYIADAEATKNSDKKSYYESLLNLAFGSEQISFINQFFNHSLIKKRIVMLQKSKSARAAKFKFLILIPLIFAMLTYVSCSDTTNLTDGENENMEVLTPPAPPAPPTPPEGISKKDAELINQLETELKQMREDGASFETIAKAYMTESNKHIKSKEAFYRMRVFSDWIFKNNKEKKIADGTWTEEDEKGHQEMREKGVNQTYEDYVAYRKTQPKKEVFTNDGIPFASIEKVPTYPGCEGLENDATKACMSEKIQNFVAENFNTTTVKPYAKKGNNRVYVRFAITKEGTIDNIQARASSPELAEEGKRVVAMLPKMKPGKNDGKPVSVVYSLPIIFQKDE
ncbi:M56 family metallopeptidase [Mesonia aestuariivivens]|uniref:M56 family metallopeptidase n=1 Tax=Mesonia aestuariivivens TaxID=2796128 RepID=A0ABS6W317_9FLAO|nr:M56 family metallopeptidase [Mesonia aestuariivivens]MBW2962251.1 M56 family metallopeptidase [Mesonia aestuariivivens]